MSSHWLLDAVVWQALGFVETWGGLVLVAVGLVAGGLISGSFRGNAREL